VVFRSSLWDSLCFRLREEDTLPSLLLPEPEERDEGMDPLLARPLRRPLSTRLLTPFAADFNFCGSSSRQFEQTQEERMDTSWEGSSSTLDASEGVENEKEIERMCVRGLVCVCGEGGWTYGSWSARGDL